MKSDLLLRIKDAETAADQKVQAAQAEAQKIIQDARREADKLLADGRAEADAAYTDKLSTARGVAEADAKKAISNGKRQATNARKKFDDGIDGVTDRVLALFEESL